MPESRQVSRSGAVNDGAPYIFHTDPVPIDLYSEGPAGPTWYRIPSWRIEFTSEALKGVDCRVHRGLGHEGQWTLSEASTGFKMFGELPDDHGTAEGMLSEFAASTMLKLTPELVAKSIAKAKEILKGKMPSPFAPRSESEAPLPMVLHCPNCKAQHIDAPQPATGWTNPPHRSHECQLCGCIWRPADVPTNGVVAIATKGKKDWAL